MLQVILILTFLCFAMLSFEILKFFFYKSSRIRRIDKYITPEQIQEEKKKTNHKEYKAGLGIIAKQVGSARFLAGYKAKVQVKLTHAHILLKAEEYIAVCLILFTCLGLLVFLPTRNILISITIGIIGWLIPSILIKSRIKKRSKHLNEQLGDAVVLISNSLKAGYGFFQAIDIVAKEMTGPISEEFQIVQKEINLGTTTEKALENLAERVASDDLELVITAVLIQRQIGGNLSIILDSISTTIRERVKLKGEVKALTAQGRMSGIVISLLPPGLGVIIYLISPDHMGALFSHPVGILIIVFSIIMELMGIYFINRIVKIEM